MLNQLAGIYQYFRACNDLRHFLSIKAEKKTLVTFQKKKWLFQALQRTARKKLEEKTGAPVMFGHGHAIGAQTGLLGFFRKQARSVLESS